jgi:hypothetical protein
MVGRGAGRMREGGVGQVGACKGHIPWQLRLQAGGHNHLGRDLTLRDETASLNDQQTIQPLLENHNQILFVKNQKPKSIITQGF